MTVAPHEVEHFRAVLIRRVGWRFDDYKWRQLGAVLQRRLNALGEPAEHYLARLDSATVCGELGLLARELTVGETYLFRNSEQFRALAEIALPARMRARAAAKSLRLVSAGCASGEEPYSLAITVAETIAAPDWTVSIRAVDLNPAALAKAALARFSPWSLRETPEATRSRWFHRDGRDLILDDAPRAAVAFEHRNLAGDEADLWAPASLDIVFCRNVTMYFAPEQARALIARIAASLLPGGYLFLGHAETLRGLSDSFHLRHTHGTFYYERKAAAVAPPAAVAALAGSDAWVDTIGRASARVAALAIPPAADGTKPRAEPRWDVAEAFGLFRADRYPEALAVVRARPARRQDDPELLLLEAMLLVHCGLREAAEACCGQLLARDEFNADAYYILGMCRENAGDRDAAAEHNRVAAYLDPGFAMPRLHLGLLARRAGKRHRARREFSHALALLRREDAARVLLFGGGFGRDALVALCESALRDCGGRG